MKSQPYRLQDGQWEKCTPDIATHLEFRMPGPSGVLRLPVIIRGERRSSPCWTWDGNIEAPTLKPSIRTQGGNYLCHSFLNAGRVRFLGDCTHELRNQTVDLLDL